MRVQIDGVTLPASGALAPYLRVALNSSNVLAAAGAADRGLGTLDERVLAGETHAGIVPWNAAGTRYLVASAAISQYAKVYPSAGGKISATENGPALGIALFEASGDGAIIEVLVVDLDAEASIGVIQQTVAFDDFTDNTDATGYVDLDDLIPAGSLVLGWEGDVATGFTGDTTAVAQVGVSGNINQFSALTTGSVLAAGKIGSHAPGSSDNAYVASAVAPRVTVTGAADFGSIAAGEMTVTLLYIKFPTAA